MQNQPTRFDRMCSRLWIILAVGSVIALTSLFSARAATAAVPATVWSDARRTYEIRQLQVQNARQAAKIQRLQKDVANLYQNTAFLQDFILCHVAWDTSSVLNANHTAGDRAEACARIGL